MAATPFHLFPNLSTEIRLEVWYFAVQNEPQDRRVIEIHSYDPSARTVVVATSKHYPSLFYVNREARYEAIKYFPGQMVTLDLEPKGVKENVEEHGEHEEKSPAKKVELFMDFHQDTLFISERFSQTHGNLVAFTRMKHRLTELASIMPREAIAKLETLQITCVGSLELNEPNFVGNNIPGNYFEVFKSGALKEVVLLLTKPRSDAYVLLRHVEIDVERGMGGTSSDRIRVVAICYSYCEGAIEADVLWTESPELKTINATYDIEGIWSAKKVEENIRNLEVKEAKEQAEFEDEQFYDWRDAVNYSNRNDW